MATALYLLHAVGGTAHAQDKSFRAFTAVVQIIGVSSTGKRAERIHEERRLSDGSSITRQLLFNGNHIPLTSYVDAQKSVRVVVDGNSKSITTYRVKKPASLVKYCPADPTIPPILEYSLYHHEDVHTTASGKFIVTGYEAPALNCFPLSADWKTFDSTGKLLFEQTTTVLSLTLGDTSRSELSSPTDYTERAPSQVLSMAAQKEGRKCLPCEAKSYLAQDSAYQQ